MLHARTLEITDLGPFVDRREEWELLQPLVGCSMLELGAKRNHKRGQSYKQFFERCGYRHVSIDLNGHDGAEPLDLCRPLNLGPFDMVTNFGTTEHVDSQLAVWCNVLDALDIGSVLCSTTPAPGNWEWHGRFYPEITFYSELALRNGLAVQRLYESGDPPRRMIFARMMRLTHEVMSVPTEHIVVNEGGGYVGKHSDL